MVIKFLCPQCQKGFSVKDEHAGKKGKCPSCGRVLRIPAVRSVKPQPEERHSNEAHTCSVCGDRFSIGEVLEENGRIVCSACSESSRGSLTSRCGRKLILLSSIGAALIVGTCIGLYLLLTGVTPDGRKEADPHISYGENKSKERVIRSEEALLLTDVNPDGKQETGPHISYGENKDQELVTRLGEVFRQDFWIRVERKPTKMDVELLSYLMHSLGNFRLSKDADTNAKLRKVRQTTDLFIKVPDPNWSEFAYRHGKIPVYELPAKSHIDFDIDQKTLARRIYTQTKDHFSLDKIYDQPVRQYEVTATMFVCDANSVVGCERRTAIDPPLPDDLTVKRAFLSIRGEIVGYHTARDEVMTKLRDAEVVWAKSPYSPLQNPASHPENTSSFLKGCTLLIWGEDLGGVWSLRRFGTDYPESILNARVKSILEPTGKSLGAVSEQFLEDGDSGRADLAKATEMISEAVRNDKPELALTAYRGYLADRSDVHLQKELLDKLVEAYTNNYRSKFWIRVRQEGEWTQKYVQTLAYLQRLCAYARVRVSSSMAQRLGAIAETAEIFVKIQDGKWADFVHRHGRIPVLDQNARFELILREEEHTIDSRMYLGTAVSRTVKRTSVTGTLMLRDKKMGGDEATIWSATCDACDPPLPDRMSFATTQVSGYPTEETGYHTARSEVHNKLRESDHDGLKTGHAPLNIRPDTIEDENLFYWGCAYLLAESDVAGMKRLQLLYRRFPKSKFRPDVTEILGPLAEIPLESY